MISKALTQSEAIAALTKLALVEKFFDIRNITLLCWGDAKMLLKDSGAALYEMSARVEMRKGKIFAYNPDLQSYDAEIYLSGGKYTIAVD